MPTVTLHTSTAHASPNGTDTETQLPTSNEATSSSAQNPLPPLLHTPHGLAILEIQGTLNIPSLTAPSHHDHHPTSTPATPAPKPPAQTRTYLPSAMDLDAIPSSSPPAPPSSPPAPNAPRQNATSTDDGPEEQGDGGGGDDVHIGRLVFANDAMDPGHELGAAARKVFFYVGGRQRLVGEMKKLPRPYAVIRKRERSPSGDDGEEELEVVDVVRYKIYFGGRPEFV